MLLLSPFVEEENDFQPKRRTLGQVAVTDSNSGRGEVVYQTEESVVLQTANVYLTTWGGIENTTSVASSSSNAHYYITAKRRF